MGDGPINVGDGCLRRRGKKGIISMKYYDVNGRQREESCRTADLDTAKRMLAERIGAIKKGVPVTPKIGRYTLEDAKADITTDYGLKENDSTDHMLRRVGYLTAYFGLKRRMVTITAAQIVTYAQKRRHEDGASQATVNRELAALRRMFNLGIRLGKLLVRPYISVTKERNARSGFFEVEAFQRVRAALPDDLQVLATAAYFTGWRVRSELMPLEWKHVDRRRGVLMLPPEMAKNDEGREFPYKQITELAAAIDQCWAVHEDLATAGKLVPQIFVRWHGKKSRGKPVKHWRKAWRSACAAAGVVNIPHDFRRTAVRNLDRSGVPRTVGMEMVGHKTEAIYRRYRIVPEQDVIAGAARLDDLYTRETAPQPPSPPATGQQGQKQGQITSPVKAAVSARRLTLVK